MKLILSIGMHYETRTKVSSDDRIKYVNLPLVE